ncbi:uncharacterized protein LOC125708126 [Brienomyrus brachyistius]|uniref:uncharacterized protein LOC125708126 n=1 Tax=Brienomyrus brachyistius TaxID=42636 RepID=UPI0020B44192|nr:uncharacterized protein LOC125708126 [Brienomyrus brachyistius]
MAASVWTSIVLWALLRMCRGYARETTVFSSEGQKVTLPCHRTSTKCSTTTWNHNMNGTIEIVGHGVVRNNLSGNRTKRLTVEPNCSLTILNVTPADAGQYNCRVYNDQEEYDDSLVHLTVLSITSSQLKPKTLNCSLHTYEICTKHIQNDMNLTWLKDDGSDLKQDTRYNITQSRCHSTLTGTLDQSDHNGNWTCQLTVDGKLESSASYITSLSAPANFTVIAVVTFCAVLCAGVCITIIIITCKRKEKRDDVTKTGDKDTPSSQDKVETGTVVYADVCVRMDGRQERGRVHPHPDTEYATLKVGV